LRVKKGPGRPKGKDSRGRYAVGGKRCAIGRGERSGDGDLDDVGGDGTAIEKDAAYCVEGEEGTPAMKGKDKTAWGADSPIATQRGGQWPCNANCRLCKGNAVLTEKVLHLPEKEQARGGGGGKIKPSVHNSVSVGKKEAALEQV